MLRTRSRRPSGLGVLLFAAIAAVLSGCGAAGAGDQSVGDGGNPDTYAIGDVGPSGGIVFYDKQSYSDGWRYLEAAPASTEWSSIPWGGAGTAVGAPAQGTAIGQGAANTAAIVSAYGDTEPFANKTDYAAKLAAELVHGGYDDWFLPSKEELNEMYVNLQQEGLGDFADVPYWSSSEASETHAWNQSMFGGGGQFESSKASEPYVRAVRAF